MVETSKEGMLFEEILNLPSTSEMVVEPTEVIVAKASGLFVIDSFTIVNLKLA
jgi:hypothetical protein